MRIIHLLSFNIFGIGYLLGAYYVMQYLILFKFIDTLLFYDPIPMDEATRLNCAFQDITIILMGIIGIITRKLMDELVNRTGLPFLTPKIKIE